MYKRKWIWCLIENIIYRKYFICDCWAEQTQRSARQQCQHIFHGPETNCNSSPAGDFPIGPSTCQSSCRTRPRLQGHMVLTQRLKVCLNSSDHTQNTKTIETQQVSDWKEKFFYFWSCWAAGFTTSECFLQCFLYFQELLCFLELWSSVRIQQTTSQTEDVYSWPNYWFTLTLTWYECVQSPNNPESL